MIDASGAAVVDSPINTANNIAVEIVVYYLETVLWDAAVRLVRLNLGSTTKPRNNAVDRSWSLNRKYVVVEVQSQKRKNAVHQGPWSLDSNWFLTCNFVDD